MIALAVGWVAVFVYVVMDTPTSPRAYAETWMGAPLDALLAKQGVATKIIERSDGVPGMVLTYYFKDWDGMKGRVYPGSFLASWVGEPEMESQQLFTPVAGINSFCEISFASGQDGVIDKITYGGDSCG